MVESGGGAGALSEDGVRSGCAGCVDCVVEVSCGAGAEAEGDRARAAPQPKAAIAANFHVARMAGQNYIAEEAQKMGYRQRNCPPCCALSMRNTTPRGESVEGSELISG